MTYFAVLHNNNIVMGKTRVLWLNIFWTPANMFIFHIAYHISMIF